MSRRSVVPVLAALALTACAGSSDDGAATTGATTTTTLVAAPPVAPSSSGPAAAPTTAPSAPSTTAVAPTTAPSAPTTTGVAPEGFDRVAGRVTAADGSTCDVCLWLAATPEQRARGLMGVTDLSGADGMVFRWDEPTTGGFWMRDTPRPLSIAFFAANGTFVSATDMEPCLQPTPDAECARYAAEAEYQFAVEVAAGGLEPLLIGPGSRLEVSATATCPGQT